MADGDSLGPYTQKRAWAFIYTLFMAHENREGNPEEGEIRIERDNWKDDRTTGHPTLEVTANKKDLLKVIQKQKTILGKLKFSEEHFSSVYNTWLARKPLHILQDLRDSNRGLKANRYKFRLKLWSTVLKDNEREFNKAWQEGKQHKNSQENSSSYNINYEKCPYQGLFAFEKEDAAFFFGRETLINNLVKAVQEKPIVAVVGSSGIGKSSVIRAGLIPKLESSRAWNIVIFRPTDNPFYQLAKALLELFNPNIDPCEQERNAKKYVDDFKNKIFLLKTILESKLENISYKQRFLIFIDQFEELYTLTSEDEKNKFLGQLLEVVELNGQQNKPRVIIVIALRSDFFGRAIEYPALAEALNTWNQVNMSNMIISELKLAIEKPAQVVNLEIEDGLTDIILDDIKNNLGGLPLLQFTLDKLWNKCMDGKKLTISAYQEIGGVEKALANHAEDVYNRLNEKQKKQAKYIFTQLVRFGEKTDDTRRLATRDEIGIENWDLVQKLAASELELEARLVVTDYDESKKQPTVEVVHEALIREWGRLKEWMNEDREFRKWQDKLRIKKDVWESSGKDNGALLRGALLVEAENWLNIRAASITNPKEIEFILASRQYQEQEEIERIKELLTLSQKELQLKQQLSSLVIAVKAGVKLRKIKEPAEDLKRKVIEILQQVTHEISEKNQLIGHTRGVVSTAFSRGGSVIASASEDHTVILWNIKGQLFKTFKGHTHEVYGISFSPDNKIIASASGDRTVKLWNLKGEVLTTLAGHDGWLRGVSFSPDGKIIASASSDATVRLWNLKGELLTTLEGHTEWVQGVSFSPDGKIIASASSDRTVKLWNLKGKLLTTLKGHTEWVRGVSFSPNDKIIASASGDGTVRLWNLKGKLLKTIEAHTEPIWGVNFSPDGKIIASASSDKTVKLWNPQGTLLNTLEGHTDRIWEVNFSPDGKIIASASADKTVRLWRIDPKDLILDLDVKLDNLLKKGCNWIRDYLKTNPNVSESDRNLCKDICSPQ